MRKNPFRTALLVLALTLSQWLVIAHVLQHPAYETTEQFCQIGLHAQGLDSGAITSVALGLPHVDASEAVFTITTAPTERSAYRTISIRGPPLPFA